MKKKKNPKPKMKKKMGGDLKMQKKIALKLREKIAEVEKHFSNPDRKKNQNKEIFKFKKVVPLSELTAGVFFEKNSGKQAVAFFYFLATEDGGYWQYFFPKESHVFGLKKLAQLMHEVNLHNFDFNFLPEEKN